MRVGARERRVGRLIHSLISDVIRRPTVDHVCGTSSLCCCYPPSLHVGDARQSPFIRSINTSAVREFDDCGLDSFLGNLHLFRR
ncbi:hypothetical protein GW17_00021602 [Ensete ventricosum]|nr:hypothetical protein GW17_00021602 [Ensete ventricosum]